MMRLGVLINHSYHSLLTGLEIRDPELLVTFE
jgi:hypothetical protein